MAIDSNAFFLFYFIFLNFEDDEVSEMCIPAFSLWCNQKIEQILFLFFFHHNINLHAIKLHRKQSISLTFTKRKKKEKQEEKIWQKFVYYFQNIIFLTMLSG